MVQCAKPGGVGGGGVATMATNSYWLFFERENFHGHKSYTEMLKMLACAVKGEQNDYFC